MGSIKTAWFEVDHKGMRELHSGRESWQVIKELVSNSFDEESVSACEVVLKSITERMAQLTVSDNGKGFADIKDAWTLMASTPKRGKPTVRGRFNIGEKELLCTAKEASITTSGYRISFGENGRRVTKLKELVKGTTVKSTLYLGTRQVENAVNALKRIIPPKEIRYSINGEIIFSKTPYKTIEATLETTVWIDGIESKHHRKTEVQLFKDDNWLYEMGIPVQTIETPYGVNVLQKIPLPPNRDVVRDAYLQDIYTIVLNATAQEVTNPSETWVHTAMEDKDVSPEAVQTIVKKRYGDKVVLWSNDPRANDKARLDGYEIVHGRTLSETERGTLQNLGGVQYSATVFPTSFKSVPKIPEDKWTDGMKRTVAYAQYLHNLLLHKYLYVEFISDMQINSTASYGLGSLTFNKVHCGNGFFEAITPQVTGLLLHEFAHNQLDEGTEHGSKWYAEFQKLAGEAVHYASQVEDFRQWLNKGGTI